jgi:LacI family transcriptional regulator
VAPRTVTLADVAAHAGVSLATASRALHGSPRQVQRGLRDKVRESAAALGYSANTQAQAVARGTGNTVAVVVTDIADPYFSAIASGVIGVAVQRGLVVTMSIADADPRQRTAAVQALTGQRPRAVILPATRSRSPESEALLTAALAAVEATGGRVCFVGSSVPAPAADFRMVPVRNRDSAARLADALVDRGYRDFCVLAGDPGLVTPSERTAGFADQLRRRGIALPDRRIVPGAFSREGAVTAMGQVLSSGDRPDCVFAVTDVMAVGAMTTMRELGLAPGADMGVAGFDDIEMLEDVTPSLSTVALPLAQIGARALELALADDDESAAALAEPVAGTVVLRDSTPGR